MWGNFKNNIAQYKLGPCNEAIHKNFRELRKDRKKPDPRSAIVCGFVNLYESSIFLHHKIKNRKYPVSQKINPTLKISPSTICQDF